jgi:N-acetyl-anhydromuramyl-L-alanine amidase AmpD
MFEIIKYGDFKTKNTEEKKHQIILTHTSRNLNEFTQSLKYRYNGKNKKIPNYIITKEGKILQLLDNTEYSEIFIDDRINRTSIVVCLENLGWLQKEPLNDHYVNWIGDIYKGVVYEKKWRDYYFWQPYTTLQVEATALLCKKLFKEMSIKNHLIGHNTKINGVEKFEGIVTRSNYNQNYTDLNPSFDFELFLKNIEDEQFT